MLEKTNNKFYVQLSSTIDESRIIQISRNAQIDEFDKPNGNVFFEVSSLKEATILCRNFINQYNLSSSNWFGGNVVDENYKFIARVSYNGKVWDNEDWRKSKEIEI